MLVELILIVGQHPNQDNVVGYHSVNPMFGSLSPRRADLTKQSLITQFDVSISDGEVIITDGAASLGATPTLTTATGIVVQMSYVGDTYIGSSMPFVTHLHKHLGGVVNIIADTEAIVKQAKDAQQTTSPISQTNPTKDINLMTKPELLQYLKDVGAVGVDPMLPVDIIRNIAQGA